jgi:hypothetical protein
MIVETFFFVVIFARQGANNYHDHWIAEDL